MQYRDDTLRHTSTAQGEELWKLIRTSGSDLFMNPVLTQNLTEEMAVFLAGKKSTSSDMLGMLADDSRFRGSYQLKLALCKNPKTPAKIVLSLLKFLRVFDLGEITKNRNIPIAIRKKTEYSLREKIPTMPSGVKAALAKRSSPEIIIALLETGDRHTLAACLDSPLLTEDHLCRLITSPVSPPLFIRAVAEHAKWSLRYRIRYALIRNNCTPMLCVAKFIRSLKTTDLRELYADSALPSSSRPYLFHELLLREESVEIPQQERYNLPHDEDPDCSHAELP